MSGLPAPFYCTPWSLGKTLYAFMWFYHFNVSSETPKRLSHPPFGIQTGKMVSVGSQPRLIFSVRFPVGALLIEPSSFPHKFFAIFTAF